MDFIAEYKSRLKDNDCKEESLRYLRELGATPIETIKALMKVHDLPLAKAKEIFSQSPSWVDENKSADRLHQGLIDTIQNEKY